jgi:transposase
VKPVAYLKSSYCGLCGDEKSSAGKLMRTSLSKRRNKHIQRVLTEAAKLAPKEDNDLALVYERARQKESAAGGRFMR